MKLVAHKGLVGECVTIYGTPHQFLPPLGVLEPQPTAENAGKLVAGHPGFCWVEVADPDSKEPSPTATAQAPDFKSMPYAELRKEAKARGIKTYGLNTAELIAALEAHED